ncbi:carbohydrate-binding family 9-like protein [Anaerocolumna jejuensis]|uniref:carbohydrate-binding family 9-like protein n=1 Tax=Anaerocolumna jejuensis TaxID=259063 RepID=UPI003F7CBC41
MNPIRIPIPAVDFNPPVYPCHRAAKPFLLDGRLDKPFWEDAPFTSAFLDIEGEHMPSPRFPTRAKMLWDDENLYIGAQLDGNEIWGYVDKRDDIIFQDNDFEIFIDPDSDTQQYYEFEMNVLNTLWDLFLPAAYRDNGSGLSGYDIHGLRTAVFVDGTVNQPSAANRSWSVEVVIPFAALTECLPQKRSPKEGEYYRINFSRVQWKTDVKDDRYQKRTDPSTGQFLPEDNWVWAPTGVINIHYPELWAFVFFTGMEKESSSWAILEDEYRKWELRKLYYAQQIFLDLNGQYSRNLEELTDILEKYAPSNANRRVKPLPYRIETTSHTFEISCPSSDGNKEVLIYSNGKTEVR